MVNGGLTTKGAIRGTGLSLLWGLISGGARASEASGTVLAAHRANGEEFDTFRAPTSWAIAERSPWRFDAACRICDGGR